MKLLFVDDEENILENIKRNLHSFSKEWESHFASGGREALEKCEANDFNLIITDATMPEMNGKVLLRKLRENKKISRNPNDYTYRLRRRPNPKGST